MKVRKMTRTVLWQVSLLISELGLFIRVSNGAMQYIENSSERRDSYDHHYGTSQEKWADSAYRYINTLNCSDNTNAFFTTKRECKDLVKIQRTRMNVYVAKPSMFGYKYKTFLPDEPLSRAASHDAVVVVDPYPLANFGHLVVVFYVDNNINPGDCHNMDGLNIGHKQCMRLALRRRCKNALERRFRRRNYARRCEINFLPVARLDFSGGSSETFPSKRENHLECQSRLAGFGQCPKLRDLKDTKELICNPIRDNTQRCSTTHETVHTSCRMFEICDQAVILSGGWNRQTTGTRHLNNVELFYWMLRKNGFKKRNIKIFFANGASGIHVPGDHAHQVLPAAMKLAFRYHIQTMCQTIHCVDSLVLYMNSPTKTDGTSLLWDVNGNGMAEDEEQYTIDELKSDLAFCRARKVHMVIDQSYAGEVAHVFKNSEAHKNIIVFASGKDNEYAFNDDYTIHWVQANHKRDCSRRVHEDSTNEIKSSSPVMREGVPGTVKATIFGAPCDITPEFTDQELRDNYLGCQNLSTAEWLSNMINGGKSSKSSKGD